MSNKPLRNAKGETLEEFLANYHPGDYPHPSVTVDLLVFSLERDTPELLLVRRGNHPWLGCWALPGGFSELGEYTRDAAARELNEECHVTGLTLSEVGLFSGPDRDPRDWTMSNAFAALVRRSELAAHAGDDAAEAGWFALDWTLEGDTLSLTLTRGEEVLRARVEIAVQEGAFGTEYIPTGYETEDIACDHCKMIALAVLKLRDAGRL